MLVRCRGSIPTHDLASGSTGFPAFGGASANADSGTPAFRPPRQWVNDLWAQARAAGCLIYEKTNLLERVREMPGAATVKPLDVPGAFKMRYLQRDIVEAKAYAKEMAMTP